MLLNPNRWRKRSNVAWCFFHRPCARSGSTCRGRTMAGIGNLVDSCSLCSMDARDLRDLSLRHLVRRVHHCCLGSRVASFVWTLTSRGAASAGAAAASHAWLRFDVRWTIAIAALWLILSAMRAGDLLFHVFRLRRLWRTATPIETANPGVSSRTFQLCSTQFLDRPSVIGFFRPRILIPGWLLPRLSADEFRQIVLHESTHLARRDDWTNLLQQLFLIVFPLNPGLWWID